MPLSDLKIRQLKPEAKPKKYADGGGLYLEVKPNGAKIWRYAFRAPGAKNPKSYTIGHYPDVSLAEARKRHQEAVELVRQGKDPVKVRQQERLAQKHENGNTFQAIADEWLAKNQSGWTERYYQKIRRCLELDVYPVLGAHPVREITSSQVYQILLKREKKTPYLAVSIRQWISAICCFAVMTGRADNDPAAPLRRAITTPQTEHAKPMMDTDIKLLLSRLKDYKGQATTLFAFKLLLYTFVRTKELRMAEWSEFDLDNGLWTIPAEKMKMRRLHVVPLSRQALAALDELKQWTGERKQLFPHMSDPGKVMSPATINRAIEYMGYAPKQITGHDFRATASTHLNEMGFNPDAIERQLAHVEKSSSRKPYNHAEYLQERKKMMQAWADWVDSL